MLSREESNYPCNRSSVKQWVLWFNPYACICAQHQKCIFKGALVGRTSVRACEYLFVELTRSYSISLSSSLLPAPGEEREEVETHSWQEYGIPPPFPLIISLNQISDHDGSLKVIRSTHSSPALLLSLHLFVRFASCAPSFSCPLFSAIPSSSQPGFEPRCTAVIFRCPLLCLVSYFSFYWFSLVVFFKCQ